MMMPGQTPYTPEEKKAIEKLINGAARATEIFDEDELEEYARTHNESGIHSEKLL